MECKYCDENGECVAESHQIEKFEQRVSALTEEIRVLRGQVAELTKLNSAARCWLTLYDGGRWDTHEDLINDIATAREVLEGGDKGNEHIIELFKKWQSQSIDFT